MADTMLPVPVAGGAAPAQGDQQPQQEKQSVVQLAMKVCVEAA